MIYKMIKLFIKILFCLIFVYGAIQAQNEEIQEQEHIPPKISDSTLPKEEEDVVEENLGEETNKIEEQIEEEQVKEEQEKNDNSNDIGDNSPKVDDTNWLEVNKIQFRCLDKITGYFKQFELQVGKEVHFKKLRVLLHYAVESKKFVATDTCVFVEIFETTKEGEWIRYFSGWMFASNPSISALKHPVYDVWVVDQRIPY